MKTENDGYHDDTDDKVRNLLWSSWEIFEILSHHLMGSSTLDVFLWDITKHREFMYGLDVSESRVYHGFCPPVLAIFIWKVLREPMESWGA